MSSQYLRLTNRRQIEKKHPLRAVVRTWRPATEKTQSQVQFSELGRRYSLATCVLSISLSPRAVAIAFVRKRLCQPVSIARGCVTGRIFGRHAPRLAFLDKLCTQLRLD